jgi:hypothetical protein
MFDHLRLGRTRRCAWASITLALFTALLLSDAFSAPYVQPGATNIPRFNPPLHFPTDSWPLTIALADFNNDLWNDLAVIRRVPSPIPEPGKVNLLMNTTASISSTVRFSALITYTLTTANDSIVAADFNNDQLPDLAVGSFRVVDVLINTTYTGSMTPHFADPVQVEAGGFSMAVGDLNADGRLDLAAVAPFFGTITALINTTPSLSAQASFAPFVIRQRTDNPRSIVTNDFNHDGRPDLAVVSGGSSGVSVFLNTTTAGSAIASFGPPLLFASDVYTTVVATGDMNGDGRPDLILGADATQVLTLLFNTTTDNSSILSFDAGGSIATPTPGRAITVGDLNNDQRPDLAVAHINDMLPDTTGMSILINQTAQGDLIPNFVAEGPFAGTDPLDVTIGDLNNDGTGDLVVPDWRRSRVSVLVNHQGPWVHYMPWIVL